MWTFRFNTEVLEQNPIWAPVSCNCNISLYIIVTGGHQEGEKAKLLYAMPKIKANFPVNLLLFSFYMMLYVLSGLTGPSQFEVGSVSEMTDTG